MSNLSHINADGEVNMVGVEAKSVTQRTALASATVVFPEDVWNNLKQNNFELKKGNLITTAKLAGIMGAKQTHQLIPLCHPLLLEKIDVQIHATDNGFRVEGMVKTTGKTGVEMEALTAVSTTSLTIYDMCKGLSHDIIISQVQLEAKSGGKREFSR
ncbi:MAG: cyclic pyranopterin monophosphate synthase MoaC [Flavobacteriales bacterium]|nr:cyclic pyranopterin monophosphate synthase MoaC [Flavobacteriales bacterium]